MICHDYKCVFIHIPKCAGQSIEHLFLKLLNLTWETREPLLLRYNDRPELGPPRLAHLKADEYVYYNYMTQEQFESYFKFTFVRNPWDRVVSFYKYAVNNLASTEECDFKRFVMEKLPNEIWNSKYWFVGPENEFIYDKDGKILVNFVGRFENLQSDFNHVCTRIGLAPIEVPHVNKSEQKHESFLNPKQMVKRLLKISGVSRHSPVSYQDFYDDESSECVAELYSADIKLFNYQFD